MDYNTLHVEREDGFCFVRINRPHIANKLSVECMRELAAVLDEAAEDRSCFSVVLAGQSDFFCSGGELGDFRTKSVLEIKAFGEAFITLHLSMVNFPKPIIAAVEGDALGGGFSLVEACDLAVGAQEAQFAVPEILDGLAPAMGLSGIFANLGKKDVMALGLLGTKFTAQKALDLGMLNFVEPRERVVEKARELAGFFKTASPTAVRLFKELYADMGMRAYDNRLRMGQAMMVALFKSKDGMEVLNSKEEKRKPVWDGQ
jgi:enoyl-CoA hydratase/carnithine racemase